MSAVALSAATEEIVSEPEPEKKPDIPERRTYSPLQAEALKKDSEIESCLSMVEALLGTTLGDAHMQLILYLMSDLGFSLDLVITLYGTGQKKAFAPPRRPRTRLPRLTVHTRQSPEPSASTARWLRQKKRLLTNGVPTTFPMRFWRRLAAEQCYNQAIPI